MRTSLPRRHRVWRAECLALLVAMLGARALHYATPHLPPAIDRLLGAVMHFSMHSVVLVAIAAPIEPVLAVLLMVGFLVRPRWYVERIDGAWTARPWVQSLAWGILAFCHFTLDMNPRVALACAWVLLLLVAARSVRWRRTATVVWIAVTALIAASRWTGADGVAVLSFGVLIGFVAIAGRPVIAARDRAWVLLACGALAQVVAGYVPLRWPRHGGQLLGMGGVYSFCENTDRGLVFATVPNCTDLGPGCLDGHLVQFDAHDVSAPARVLRFFDTSFYGRLMYPLCLPDTVRIGMAQTLVAGGRQAENVMEVSIAEPTRLTQSLRGSEVGQQILWDRKRDALYYSSEFSNTLVREDRRTGIVDHDVGRRLIPPSEPHWVAFGVWLSGGLTMDNAIDPVRDSLFVGNWLTGSTVYEIDLERLALRAEYHPNNGGTTGITVDPAHERLLVTSMWGLDAIDLASGRVVTRVRLGFGTRTPVIDDANDRVYVASNIEGRIWILDRNTLAVLGALAVGKGARTPFVSATAGKLFGSSDQAYYWWDLRWLAAAYKQRP